MPPKRKNKATKAPPTIALKPLPAASPQAKRRNSLQGAKTSRLAPSEDFHMTTRRAAKTVSNHTDSTAPSTASSSSRRSSLNDIAHYDDAHSELDDERPAKRSRRSTDSGSPRPSTESFVDQLAVNGTQTPDSQNLLSRSVSNGSKASSKKRRASDGSTQSSKTVSGRPNGVLTRTQSDISELQPRRKKRRTTQTPAESVDQPPELTDASTAPNSPEQIPEVESSQSLNHVLPTNGDAPAKLGRRLPGRRRAPHSDINVETDLRRQLNLKMSYRSLAKIQKNILEELSNRTTNSLENDAEYYKQCPEYEPLMAALDQRKEQRMAEINALKSTKLDQLERVRIATEHIEKQKYIQRFQDLQEDLLLQCFYRMKQIEREMKGAYAAGTDDEDNIVAPTHVDFPQLGHDDRLGSKYASRSRAYVETDRLLDEELFRKRFDRQRKAFVAGDEDADDSIDDAPYGFASFTGPDRTEAIAHWNLNSLADAASDVERTPVLPIEPKAPTIIPNEEADALFLLASLSADAFRKDRLGDMQGQYEDDGRAVDELEDEPPAALYRQSTPVESPAPSAAIVMEVDNVPSKAPSVQDSLRQSTPPPETNGMPIRELDVPKNETPARSTHRIMDLLNDDVEVPLPKSREPQILTQDPTPGGTPSRQVRISQGATPPRGGPFGLEAIVHRQEPLSDRSSTLGQLPPQPPAYSAQPSSPSIIRYVPDRAPRIPSYMKGVSEESLRKRDPMNSLRAMLEAKTPYQRLDSSENNRTGPTERDRVQMAAPPLSRPFSPSVSHERQEFTGKEGGQLPSGGYTASPSAQPLAYNQSPSMAPTYLSRHGSQESAASHWDRDRRMSGPQASQPPAPSLYAGSPRQSYRTEQNNTGTNPPAHQSPYPAPSAPQLPSISQTLPSKAAGPPSNDRVFRFAHYDPAPPRPAYPSPTPNSYTVSPHPPSHSGTNPSPQYTPGYNNPPPYQGGYKPPPGSFQAPPPPPPPSSTTPYPTLKIRPYSGQPQPKPILPASMAPPLPQSQYSGQAAPPQHYSPPQPAAMSPRTLYDQHPGAPPREGSSEHHSDGQSRQRRPYRVYHAPGTQFRTYQGPDSSRRRGG